MSQVLLVGLGGMLGSMARYGVFRLTERLAPGSALPLATLSVNVLGCLLIGAVAGAWAERAASSEGARAFVAIGLLGGFTTFSALGLETVQLLLQGHTARALLSVALNLSLGLAAVFAGLWIGRSL